MPEDTLSNLDKADAAIAVNQYLNHYITVIDAKAGAFLAGNVAAASVLLRGWPADWWGRLATGTSISCFALATLLAGAVIYPRPPKRGNSVLFWGDIAASEDASSYVKKFNQAVELGTLDEHYSVQNYLTSRVLRLKFLLLRSSIQFFAGGLVAGFISYMRG